jgi:hypothetical protein
MEPGPSAKNSRELSETARYWEELAGRADAAELAEEMRWIAANYRDLARRARARERGEPEPGRGRFRAA